MKRYNNHPEKPAAAEGTSKETGRTLHTGGKLEVTTKLSRLFNFRIGIGIGVWGLSFVLMPIAHVKLNNNYQLSTFVCVSGLSGSIEELSRQRVLLCRFYLPLQMIIYYQCPLWLWLPCVRVTPARFCTVATFSSDFPIGRPGLVGGLTMRLQSGGNYWDWSGRESRLIADISPLLPEAFLLQGPRGFIVGAQQNINGELVS